MNSTSSFLSYKPPYDSSTPTLPSTPVVFKQDLAPPPFKEYSLCELWNVKSPPTQSEPKDSPGLKLLSKQVLSIVQDPNGSTQHSVVSELLRSFSAHTSRPKETLRKQVSDILSVLVSLGLIVERGNLFFCRPPSQDQLAHKRAKLKSLHTSYSALKCLCDRNRLQSPGALAVPLPFTGLLLRTGTSYSVTAS